MDWPAIGLTVGASWFLFLLASDVAALLRFPSRLASRAQSIAFFASLAAIVGFGFVVAERPHLNPCAGKVHLR